MKQNSTLLCGRSMLEMLAVLLIMGILSIGIFAAFRGTSQSYQTNAIIKDVMLQTNLLSSWRNIPTESDNKTIALSYKSKTGYSYTRELSDDRRSLLITVKNTDIDFCEDLIKRANGTLDQEGDKPQKGTAYVGTESNQTCTEGNANVTFKIPLLVKSYSNAFEYNPEKPDTPPPLKGALVQIVVQIRNISKIIRVLIVQQV